MEFQAKHHGIYLNLLPHIHAIRIDDELMLLNELSDQYHFLDANSTAKITDILSQPNINRQANAPTDFFVVAEKPQFLNSAESRNFGLGNFEWHHQARFRSRKCSLTKKILAIAMAIRLRRNFKKSGLHGLLDSVRKSKFNLKPKKQNSQDFDEVDEFCAAIGQISIWLPFRLKCLEMSALIALYALKRNIHCQFKIGVQRYDFLSHAWVEIAGVPIGDRHDLAKRLPTILVI